MISSDGVVKLIDLNAAKEISGESVRDTVLIGTEGYAAPEQYGFGPSGVQTDIYALGVLLNVMLTGELPQKRAYSGRLGEVIQVCTKISAQERYGSVDELMNAVQVACGIKRQDRKHWIPWLLPGYRALNPWKMILATIGYAFFFWMGFSMWVEGKSVFYNWMNRAFFLICTLSMFLITGNYMGILDFLKVTKIKNRAARWIVIAVIDAVVFFGLILILQMIVGEQG